MEATVTTFVVRVCARGARAELTRTIIGARYQSARMPQLFAALSEAASEMFKDAKCFHDSAYLNIDVTYSSSKLVDQRPSSAIRMWLEAYINGQLLQY